MSCCHNNTESTQTVPSNIDRRSIMTNYDPKVYASLPTIKAAGEALKTVKEEQMVAIATIFCKHNVQEQLGLCLLHRHFDIAPDERLVESHAAHDQGPKLYEFCETCDGHDVITETKPIKETELGIVSAHSWVLTVDSGVQAYEFQEGEHTIQLPDEFITELSAYLCQEDLLGIFGIHMHHRRGSDKTGVLIEINDPDSRINIVTNVPVKESDGAPVTHVLWKFLQGENDMPPIIELACHCSGKCVFAEH